MRNMRARELEAEDSGGARVQKERNAKRAALAEQTGTYQSTQFADKTEAVVENRNAPKSTFSDDTFSVEQSDSRKDPVQSTIK